MDKAVETSVLRVRGLGASRVEDWVAVERPLEIRARSGGGDELVISTTMRTPGEDRALVAGFLFSERVISAAAQILSLESVGEDTVLIGLGADAEAALEATRRPFVTTGACGVCGRATLDSLLAAVPARDGAADHLDHHPQISTAVVHGLPGALRAAQDAFAQTGGLHAAGLFTLEGQPRSVHEDVGRHNAVDKLVGTLLLEGRLAAARNSVLVVSGRASFELVQKAAAARIPVMAAVGAPSSLAVAIASRAGMTLLGFVRDGGFNVYSGAARIVGHT
ncbi:MAG: formate dehydrogenase accessory sulfurtransferase FdhD [Bacteroidota bacterium]